MFSRANQQPFRKKYATNQSAVTHNVKLDVFETPHKQNFRTLQTNFAQQDISQALFTLQSSRIADENDVISNRNDTYPQLLRNKMQILDEQGNKVILKKQREVYFLKVELRNYEIRLRESEEESKNRYQQIQRLRQQLQNKKETNKIFQYQQHISKLLHQNEQLQIENEKLRHSLQILINQKNCQNKKQNQFSNNSVYHLKKEVEELRLMISDMQGIIEKCPSCFTLKRNNSELKQAYESLQKIHNQILQKKNNSEKSMLQNITSKIQENQNIIRQNLLLKERKGVIGMRAGKQRLKQTVAKRCRTLTDQF